MTTPAHKQTDPEKKPGQIVNPINSDLMDDMANYCAKEVQMDAVQRQLLSRRGNPKPIEPGIPASQRVTWTESPVGMSAFMQARSFIRRAKHYGYTIEQITEGL